MIFRPIEGIDGAWTIDQEPHADERGRFARTYVPSEWAAHGITTDLDHIATSSNVRAGTLRGMHLQSAPHSEAKTVRCSRGRIFDVVVDVRAGSPGFGRWAGFELDAEAGRSLHLPAGTAHGFLTLEPESEVTYLISASYQPQSASGFRWDDPDVAIAWPDEPVIMSDRDATLPSLADWAAAQEHR